MPMLRRRRWLLIALLLPLLLLLLAILSSNLWIPRLLTYLGQDWQVKVEQSDLQLWKGRWQLSGLQAGRSETPITLSRITLDWSWADLWRQRLSMGVQLGDIHLPLDPDALTLGGWTIAQWQAPLQAEQTAQGPTDQGTEVDTTPSNKWQFKLTGFELQQLAIELPKERWPEAPLLTPLSTGGWVSTHPNDPVPFHLTLLQHPEAYLDLQGEVRLATLKGSGDIKFHHLDLAPWLKKFTLPLEQGLLDGNLNVQTQWLAPSQQASVQIKSDLKLSQLSGHFPAPLQQAHLAQLRWQGQAQWTPQDNDVLQIQGRLSTQAFQNEISQWGAASWEGRSRWNGQTEAGLKSIDIDGVLTAHDLKTRYVVDQQPITGQLDTLHWAQHHASGTQEFSGSLRITGLKTTVTPAALSLNQIQIPHFQLTPESLDVDQMALEQLKVYPEDQDSALHQLDQVQLQQIQLNWVQHEAKVEGILLGAAHHELTLNAQNQLIPWQPWATQWQSQFNSDRQPQPAPTQPLQSDSTTAVTATENEATDNRTETAPWHWQVGRIQITAPWQIKLNNQALKRPWQTQLSIDKAHIGPLDSTQSPANFDIDARLDQEAHIQLTGQFQPRDRHTTLNADIKGLDAASITPYSETYAGLEINNGRFNVDVSLKQQGEAIEGRAIVDLYSLDAKPISEADASRLKRLLNMPVSSLIDVLEDDQRHIHLELPIHKTANSTNVGLSDVILLATRRAAEQATMFYLGQMLQPWATVYTVGKFAYNQTEKMLRVDLPPLAFTPATTALTSAHRQYLDQVTQVLNERHSLGLHLCAGIGQQEALLLTALADPAQATDKTKALIQALQPIEEARQNLDKAPKIKAEATASEWSRLRMQHARSALVDRGISPERLFFCTQPGQQQPQEESHLTIKLQD
ncbi:hypothetical protein BFW38_09265 [Terasakiispira papahanaumokuakeensis]|uniref:OmpA-like domain-containing protein n=1 Tax=Terasakiispira papahanaumokuakeensis TaxID=197479 RepID=A0A1E2VA20_9GAMM|nr:DUF748 domain-containing protein [Terasakiispira papahanaumokuakeensis]ODC03702.1 hypothetical protein BFW38_09265 [Terasakiispira papahanaumokuakeensis]